MSVTILTCAPGKRAHKLFRADGTVDDYDAGGLFKFTVVPVGSLLELCAVIETVRGRADAFLIYGEPVRTFLVPQPRKWVGADPTLRHRDRRWLCLDFDATRATTVEELRDSLPEGMRHAAVAFVPSARYSPDALRGKLFVWFDRPISLEEAERIAKSAGADPSVTRAGQPIYVADPRFEAPLTDPCPDRNIVLLDGGDATVPAALPDLDKPKLLETQSPNRATTDTRREAAIDWCKRAPIAVEGAKGQTDLFNLLATLIAGYGLDRDDASAIAAEHYNPRCLPPFDVDSQEWEHKLDDASAATRDPEYLIDAYEAATFSQQGLKDRSAGDGSAWFEDGAFAQLLELFRSDELQFERTMNELEKLLPKGQARKLNKLVRKAARELAKRAPAERGKREIIAFDGRAWVADGNGGYTAPVKKSNLLVRLENLGRSDLICGDEKTTWRFNVSLATEFVRDFGTRVRARWEDPERIFAGYPEFATAAEFDADVDAWLRAMFAEGYDAVAQWIAVCCPEYAHQPSAALVIIGPSSGGKTFLAHCMAQLWGASTYVALGIAMSRFNGHAATTPVWCDDEAVELQRGRVSSADFVSLIQLREHSLELKGLERFALLGAPRVVIPINDLSQFKFRDVIGVEATKALDNRLSVHDFRARGERVLGAIARLRYPGSDDVDNGRVVRHLRWIQCNTTVGAARFAGAYSGSESTAQVIAYERARQACPEAFDLFEAALAGEPALWFQRDESGVYVYPAGLAAAASVKLRDVQEAFRALSHEHARKAQRKVGPKNVAFWKIAR